MLLNNDGASPNDGRYGDHPSGDLLATDPGQIQRRGMVQQTSEPCRIARHALPLELHNPRARAVQWREG